MSRSTIAVTCISCVFCLPLNTSADIAFGGGVSWVFGSGAALSLKGFSDDEKYKPVASFGIDYIIDKKAFRPNVGAAFLDDNTYIDASIGYALDEKSFDFSIGGGYANTDDAATGDDSSSGDGDLDPDTDLVL